MMFFAPQTRAANGIYQTINYQAKLADSSGVVVADGDYDLKISLYDAATSGNRLWTAKGTSATPTTLTVSVSDGLFTVSLGDTSSDGGSQNALTGIDWNSDNLYLGITIESDTEMTPRKRLTAVSQAFNALQLQGMYASGTASGGQTLFTVHQTDTAVATGTRTALLVRSSGESNANDYLVRMVNSSSTDAFSVSRSGNVTSTGYFTVTGTGTSTYTGGVTILGNTLLGDATTDLISATARFASGLTPASDGVYSLGSASNRWLGYFSNVTSTSATSTDFYSSTLRFVDATGTSVSTTNIFVADTLYGGSDFEVNAPTIELNATTDISLVGQSVTLMPTQYLVINPQLGFALPDTDAVTSLGSAVLRFNGYFAHVTSTNATTTNLYTSTLSVAGQSPCLASGSNCPYWTYSLNDDVLYNSTATTDILFGGSNSSSAPVYAKLTGATASSNRLIVGQNQNMDVLIGNTTSSGLHSLFQLSGNDLYVEGNIGSVSSVYTNGAFVAGSGSTYYGDGFLRETNGNYTMSASGGFITPETDRGASLGSASLRFDAALGNATSANLSVTQSLKNILSASSDFRVVTTTASGFMGTTPSHISISGRYAYVPAQGDDVLNIFDIANPINPTLVGTITVGDGPYDVAIAGMYAYVTNNIAGTLSIVDISQASSSVGVSSVVVGTSPQSVVVSGKYAYVANFGDGSVSVIDVSDPASPTVVSTLTMNQPNNLFISGRFLYITNQANATLSIVNIADPVHPSAVGTVAVGGSPRGVVVDGHYAYVANTVAGSLSIVNIANPTAAYEVTAIGVGSNPYEVAVVGRYAFVSNNGGDTISVIDISEPEDPTSIGTISVGGGPIGLRASGRHLHVMNAGGSTMSIISLDGIETTAIQAHAARLGTLDVVGDTDIGGRASVREGLMVGSGGVLTQGALNVGATNTTSSIRGNLSVGASSYAGNLNTLFTMNGDDLFVAGNMGAVSSVYSNGAFVAGTGATYFGDGFVRNYAGNINLNASGGFITPTVDRGVSLGSGTLRYNGIFGQTTSTSATSTDFYGGTVRFSTATGTDLFSNNASFGALTLSNLTWTKATGTHTTTTNLGLMGRLNNTVSTSLPISLLSTTSSGGSELVDVKVVGRYAYVLDQLGNAFLVYDILNPAAPNLLTTLALGEAPWKMHIQGSYAYIASYSDNDLLVVDISRPNAPFLVSQTAIPNGPLGIAMSGRYAYLPSYGDNLLYIVDVANPTSPQVVRTTSTGYAVPSNSGVLNPGWIAVQGRYAYIGSYTDPGTGSVFGVFDLVDPLRPRLVGSVSMVGDIIALAVQGGRAYLTVNNAGSYSTNVYSIVDPTNPSLVTQLSTEGWRGMIATGKNLYVAGGNSVAVYDVSNESSLVASALTFGTDFEAIAIDGRYAYIVDGTDNVFQVMDMTGIDTVGLSAQTAELGNLYVRSDGSIANLLSVGGGLAVGGQGIITAGSFAVSATNTTSTFMGNVSVGTSTYSVGLHAQFSMTGDDLYVAGNIGSVSSVYTNGAFVAGSASTYYGNGFINKTDGDLTISASGGFITPTADLGVTLGSSALRYNAILGGVTTTAATTTSFYVSGLMHVDGNLLASTSPTSTNFVQTTSTIEATNDVGRYPSVVLGRHGYPTVSYYDNTSGNLRVFRCSNIACTTGSSVLVDGNTTDVGKYSSIAIGTDGYPVIAYYDVTNAALKFVHCTSDDCSSADTPRTLDNTNDAGKYASIAIGVDGYPIISYHRASGFDAYVVHCTEYDCSANDSVTDIGNLQDEGLYTKIIIPPDGRPYIAHYQSSGGGIINLARCANVACRSVSNLAMDNALGAGSGYVSMALGRDGIPIVSYYKYNALDNGQIYVTRCTTTACTAADTPVLVVPGMKDYAAGNGAWTSLALSSDGMPMFTYDNAADGTRSTPRIVKCGSLDCSSSTSTIDFDSSTNDYFDGTALVRAYDGRAIAFFFHGTAANKDMVIARTCGSTVCALGGSFTGASIGSPTNYFYRMYSREMYAQQAYLAGFDLAEAYPTNDATLVPGELLAYDDVHAGKVVRANTTHRNLIGVVSTKPGLLLSEWPGSAAEGTTPVALAGRVPVKVTMEQGPIAIGDLLTLSSVPGVAMKAVRAGTVLGRALEATQTDGMIEVFVSVGYDAGPLFAEEGDSTAIKNNLVFAPVATIDATTTVSNSWGLTFRGASRDGDQIVMTDFILATHVSDAGQTEFTVRNTSGTSLFSLHPSGSAMIAGDLSLSGKLYPSSLNGLQNASYLYADLSGGASSTAISTNASWQTDDAYGFAERFYSPDALTSGDVVTVSEHGQAHVQRTLGPDQTAAGVVADRAGFVAGKTATSTFAIALMGRTSAKVSTKNGAIEVGDLLAPSTIPGVAVKAVKPGSVIGQALESYDLAEIGVVDVFVKPMWWGGHEATTTLDASTLSSSQTSAHVSAMSTQGFAQIVAGAKKVHVIFPASLGAYPNVQATPRGEVEGSWWTDGYSDLGFDIILKQEQLRDIVFSWRAEATGNGDLLMLSDGTSVIVNTTTGGAVAGTETHVTTTEAMMVTEETTSTSAEIAEVTLQEVSATGSASVIETTVEPYLIEPSSEISVVESSTEIVDMTLTEEAGESSAEQPAVERVGA